MAAKSLAAVYLSKWSKSSDTYKTMKRALERVAKTFGAENAEDFAWKDLRYEELRGFAARLRDEGLAPKTINLCLAALRGVLSVAWERGDVSGDWFMRMKTQIKSVRGRGEPSGRALDKDELDEIERNLGVLSGRDAALIAILVGAGLRRVEAVRLRKGDYDVQSGKVLAIGKGDKARRVPVGDRWLRFFEDWWATRESGELLFPVTRRQVSLVVERLCSLPRIKRFTAHDLRRTFATHVSRAAGIGVAQKLLGHANIQTTALYDRPDEETERNAVKGL